MNYKIFNIIVICIIVFQSANGQRTEGKNDLCKKRNGKKFIGQSLKIWDNGGIYPTINTGDHLDWPSVELKQKAGENHWGNYSPEAGDTGKVIHIFERDKGRVASAELIYLLEVKGNFVPIGCGYLTTLDRMDSDQEDAYWSRKRFIKDSIYAEGCKFKTSYYNNSYFGAGRFPIDRMAESYACDLLNNGIDTIILIKYFMNNHGLGQSKFEGVIWQTNGEGFLKVFKPHNKKVLKQNEKEAIEQETKPFNFDNLFKFYLKNDIKNDKTNPNPSYWLSHDNTYYIQFQYGKQFYSESLTATEVKDDSTHNKSIMWNMIINEIEKSP